MFSGEGSFDHHSPRRCITGAHLPPLQQHGRRALQPRWGFPRRRWHCSQKPTTPPSNITLTTKDN
jgi:hypothetical protein